MKLLFIISLFLLYTNLHAQTDSLNKDSLHVMHVRYYAFSNDSMRLHVVNGIVVIKQFKNENVITVSPIDFTEAKNIIDTTIKTVKRKLK